MQAPRRPSWNRLRTASGALALVSAVLVAPQIPPASAASYAGYAQGQVIARYGTITGWTGASAKYNGPAIVYYNATDRISVPGTFGLNYECVELVQRYWYLMRWITGTANKKWGAHAADMPAHIPKDASAKPQPQAVWFQQDNGPTTPKGAKPTTSPRAGDILVFGVAAGWSLGHVALITGVSSTRVTFIQQNVRKNGQDNGPPVAIDQVSITKSGTGTGTRYKVGSTSLMGSGVSYPKVLGWIHAVKNTGSAPARPVLVPASPDPPTGLTAVGTGPGAIRLSWVPGAVPGDGNEIVMVSSPGVHAPSDPGVSVRGGTTSTFTWTGLTAGQRYCFDIRARFASGHSSDWADPGETGCANTLSTTPNTYTATGFTCRWTNGSQLLLTNESVAFVDMVNPSGSWMSCSFVYAAGTVAGVPFTQQLGYCYHGTHYFAQGTVSATGTEATMKCSG